MHNTVAKLPFQALQAKLPKLRYRNTEAAAPLEMEHLLPVWRYEGSAM